MIEFFELAGADPAVRFSPYCWRIRMALAHKGVAVRLVPWHFGDRKLPGGTKQVPVMVDDGEVIAGSSDIAFHLENAYQNGPSLFGGEGGEAHAGFIVAWTDTALIPALLPILAPDILALIKPSAQVEFREARERRIGMSFETARTRRPSLIAAAQKIMAPLRRAVQEAEFLGGAEPSYADYTVFGAFQWARCINGAELLEPEDPIAIWRDTILDLFGGLARNAKIAA
jgi:glutathione S-transferase